MAAEDNQNTIGTEIGTEQGDTEQGGTDLSDAAQAAATPGDDAPVEESAAPVATATQPAVKARTGKMSAQALIQAFEAEQLKDELPQIYVGDTVKVGVRIREGNKERVQPYEGVVIAKRHGGLNATITVRRIFQGVGVERIFLLHSPQVAFVNVERRGKVRRAKLFYLRDRVGKATRVKQRFDR
ncbi:50S ribosomal protein L19 [Cyanobium sp. NIES-981]|uniref:50S ribosomal protein L19 n=1 Tax=Cyanobium sp. NIES-981 TaxID=1851505 RepID=UPI0007DD1CC4|nr:50S ribosomal protein L19 [Cyanobium sp. NIES-981]SBO41732.1 50S ribosomal protein L19 [Cyanobium sp. NIES-981]